MNRMDRTTLSRLALLVILAALILALLGGCAVNTVTINNSVEVKDSRINVEANRLTRI
ncbi:hypothetical protein 10RS306A_gene4583 [Ralstonia phage 10RS306A]|uniref:Uncharacterized protein n=1 Tax=Ralstonia phage 10RS306A TaxID=2968818 RepID=A0A977TEL5_9CAUD|nr:hypothetical protein 10RS306A_gene4583 [Ralstonia phage 10RS306A]